MTEYYVDLNNPGAWNGRDGEDAAGNQLLGISGLQYASDILAVNPSDIVYIIGTVITSTWKSCAFDANNGAFTVGEQINSGGEGGGSGTAVILKVTSPIEYEQLTGAFLNNDVLTGQTSGSDVTLSASPSNREDAWKLINAGTLADGFIKYIGVSNLAAKTNDGTFAKLDGAGSGTGGDGIQSGINYLWFENIHVDDMDDAGFNLANADQLVFANCLATFNDTDGFIVDNKGIFFRCNANNNGGDGFDVDTGNAIVFCTAHNNGGDGINYTQNQNLCFGCVAYTNTLNGFESAQASNFFVNCVGDNNTQNNFLMDVAYPGQLILGCRGTNSTAAYGIEFAGAFGTHHAYNYVPNTGQDRANSSGPTNNKQDSMALLTDGVDTNDWVGTDTDGGYENPATPDYNLASGATIRRESVALP